MINELEKIWKDTIVAWS